jgi:hypothetical protein
VATDRWRRIEEIFEEVLALPEDERNPLFQQPVRPAGSGGPHEYINIFVLGYGYGQSAA